MFVNNIRILEIDHSTGKQQSTVGTYRNVFVVLGKCCSNCRSVGHEPFWVEEIILL